LGNEQRKRLNANGVSLKKKKPNARAQGRKNRNRGNGKPGDEKRQQRIMVENRASAGSNSAHARKKIIERVAQQLAWVGEEGLHQNGSLLTKNQKLNN